MNTRPSLKSVTANTEYNWLRIALLSLIFTISFIRICSADTPNVLILYADDLRHDTLGVFQESGVLTPHLDELCKHSVRFSHNYVTTAICGISRASLLTGQWMSRHGCEAFTAFATPWNETLPGVMRSSGYYVGHVGKWHNGKFPSERYDYGKAYYKKHWFNIDGKRKHVTTRNEEDAIDFLKVRPKDKPFLLTVAFFAPHAEDKHPEQYLPQPWSEELYEGKSVPVPVNATEESWQKLPDFFNEDNEGRARWRKRFDGPENYQRMMTNYFRLVTGVDNACGKILAELAKQGIRENTLVIFTADNGYYHGEHGLADKWYPHQESIRVPLIINDPRMAKHKHGSLLNEMTLNVDLAPTILSAVGLDVPKGMQGSDLAKLYLDDSAASWRTEFFYEHPTYKSADFIPGSQALVRKDWKYIYWPDHDVEQLFDLTKDPNEESDLVDSPYSKAVLEEMRARFKQLQSNAK